MGASRSFCPISPMPPPRLVLCAPWHRQGQTRGDPGTQSHGTGCAPLLQSAGLPEVLFMAHWDGERLARRGSSRTAPDVESAPRLRPFLESPARGRARLAAGRRPRRRDRVRRQGRRRRAQGRRGNNWRRYVDGCFRQFAGQHPELGRFPWSRIRSHDRDRLSLRLDDMQRTEPNCRPEHIGWLL